MQKRKQRKRTDTRVAELEKEMRQMRSQLQKKSEARVQPESASQAQPQGNLWYRNGRTESANLEQRTQQRTAGNAHGTVTNGQDAHQDSGHAPVLWPSRLPDKPMEPPRDAVDRGLLSMATARQLFETYKTDLFHHYPLVYVAPDVTADDMRRTKPTLFLAIIAAASSKQNPELSAVLDKEVLQAYAFRSLVQSQKCLELVQALLISAVWYYPPQRFGQLKYYEYVSMAASMAMDIGIGTVSLAMQTRSVLLISTR